MTVPFIVRLETGYIDRDQYAIATLFDPGKPWTPTAPQPQFNHRLVITHGFSCDTEYTPATRRACCMPKVLGGGFIVMSHALDHAGHNCNLLTQAESLVMTKEYAIDHYGTVRWTIGSGCSGGSLAQHQVANAYPGVYQGITPQCSFPDAWSSAMQYEEYYFGLQYLEDPTRWDPGVVYDPVAISAFFDHPNIANPITFTTVIPNSGDPSRSCPGVPDDQVYDAQTNPKGVRCTLQDYMVNAFGRDENGWARRGFDNVGIQYGAQGPAPGPDLAGAVRRLQHPHRRRRPRSQHHGGAHAGRPDRAAAALPDRGDQLGQQPRPGRDHRPARARPGRLPRRLPHLRACARACSATSAPRPTRCSGAARRR